MTSDGDRPTAGQAMLKGAVAGMAGGMAMMMTTAAEQRVVRGEVSPGHMPPVDLAGTVAEQRGVELSQRQAMAAGMGAHMMYSAALGAAFGLGRRRRRGSALLDGLVLGALAYAAGFSRWGIMPRAGAAEPSTHEGATEARLQLVPHALFGLTTAAAFDSLRG